MATNKALISQTSFNSGELGPGMMARQEVARYTYGVRAMRSFIPMLQGPARKRPGAKFVAEIADSSQQAWLLPFIYAQRDAWWLEFGDNTLRFYTDRGQVLEATKTITAVSTAAEAVFTSNAHGYANGDEVVIASIVGLLDANGISVVNGRNFRVSDQTANTFKLKDLYGTYLSTATATAYTSGGTAARVYQIATPWAITDITDADTGCCLISYAQSGDVMDLCVPGFRNQTLTRTASTSWAFADYEPANGPFETVDPDQTITVYASAATGAGITLTASSSIFQSTDVGSLFLLEKKLTDANGAWETAKTAALNDIRRSQGHYYKCTDAGTTGSITPSHTEGARYDGYDPATNAQWEYQHSGYGWAKIVGYTSGTVVTADVVSRIPDQAVGAGNASTRWAFGSWSDRNGWPTHVTYFRERKCFARGTRIWGSVPADFDNFAQRDAGVIATDSAFDIDIRSGVNDEIQWMVPSSDLLVGTEGGEFSIGEISSSDPLGPDNIAALLGPGYGSRRVTPVSVNDALMYSPMSGQVLRELRFTFETDGYSAFNRTAFSEHILKGKLTQLSYQKETESIVWGCCANGDFAGMSYEREHELVAWHKHPIGGNGLVESVCVIPAPDANGYDVGMIVRRTINGQTKRYIEYLAQHWDEDTDAAADMFYVDSGLTYSGAATSILSGLHHLEGESVSVWGDAYDLGDFTVTNGQVDLGEASVTVAQAGLGYTATLESMNTIKHGFMVRVVEAWVKFQATVSAAWATITQRTLTSETGTARAFEFGNITIDSPSAPVTRLVKAPGESGNGRELFWRITHDRPTYCNVAAVTLESTQNGRDG